MGKPIGVNMYKHLGILCCVHVFILLCCVHGFHDLALKAPIGAIVPLRSPNDQSKSLFFSMFDA